LKINISQACKAGLAAQVKAAREKQWLEENREAMEYCNKDVEENGLPLERFRTFQAVRCLPLVTRRRGLLFTGF